MTDSNVTEGKVEIFQPPSVFYNPVQEFNRDLTIAVLNVYSDDFQRNLLKDEKESSQGLKILEGLSASGLR